MNDNERMQISAKAKFLYKKGYRLITENDGMIFYSEAIEFNVCLRSGEPVSDICILFHEQKEMFALGWIAFIRDGFKINTADKLQNVLLLLQYIKKNYSEITSYAHCVEGNRLIDHFLTEQLKSFRI